MSRYIDADVLLKRVEELVGDNEWYENLFCADSVCGLVEEAPTVDAVPVVHGHWVEEHKPFNDHGRIRNIKRYVCSNCGRQNGLNKHHKYCPNCGAMMGAKMDEVTDDAQ